MLPPGPSQPPAVQLVRWIRDPFGLLDECHTRFGDTFSLHLPGRIGRFVIVASPEAAKDLFALDGDQAHQANFVLKPFLGEHSLLLLDGADHIRQRKMMMPAFHGERLAAYGRTMLDLAHDAVDRLPIGRPFAIATPLRAVTLQVILRTVFGVRSAERLTELTDVLTRTVDAAAKPMLLLPPMQRDLGPLSPWGSYKRLSERASQILRSEIREGRARSSAGREDVLSMILQARDEAGRPLSEDEAHDELVTLLVAGHETTATALAWALRWLWIDPPLVARLREEIATANGDPQSLAKLELLDSVVREALRLQPVVPLAGRLLKRDTAVGGTVFDAGVAVAASIYLIHRRPSLYPHPRRFVADRFTRFKPAPWEWLPFGGGLRRCIGAAFALLEMKMILAALLPRVEASLVTPRVTPARRGITLVPSGGLAVTVSTRRARAMAA